MLPFFPLSVVEDFIKMKISGFSSCSVKQALHSVSGVNVNLDSAAKGNLAISSIYFRNA